MTKLVRNAIKHLLARGYAITVWDSIEGDGEVELRLSNDADAIFDCLGATETNRLVLHEQLEDSVWVGNVLRRRPVGELIFVYEFGEDDPLQDYAAADEEVEHDIREAFAYIV